jgi:hypothetical protein
MAAPEQEPSARAPFLGVVTASEADAALTIRLPARWLPDPASALTLEATILTVLVIDAEVFDDLFGETVQENSEG